ncbi:chorismate synthase [Alkaliphilus sp. B6464]|nr:chorismate synthase [Alkaliphilus sp. B6464]QUH21695.1 chorismate synthase [Alkaliphilus sp. B6464]
MLRYLSAGESHGKGLVAIIEGLPSNIPIDINIINEDLRRRQQGYGRGNRMKIEKDRVEIITGVRDGKTLGSPLTIMIENIDYKNWTNIMGLEKLEGEQNHIKEPRPGHGDLVGALKYNHMDIRNVIERASARETAIRTAVGSIAKQFLSIFNIEILGHVISIGQVNYRFCQKDIFNYKNRIDESPVRCIDTNVEVEMIQEIEMAKQTGDSLGGSFEVVIRNVPVGLGSYAHFDRKLDGILAQGIMGLQGIKAVEIGDGIDGSSKAGSRFHDEIGYSEVQGYYRNTNRAGGIEAGVSNGEDIIIRGYMKPIPTLTKPLKTVNMLTKKEKEAIVERSDNCAVPAASVVAEGICAFIIAMEMVEKFGGDSIEEMLSNYKRYIDYLRSR